MTFPGDQESWYHTLFLQIVSAETVIYFIIIEIQIVAPYFNSLRNQLSFCAETIWGNIHCSALYNLILRIARNFLETRKKVKIS